jgi:hypothetical protein
MDAHSTKLSIRSASGDVHHLTKQKAAVTPDCGFPTCHT